MTTIDSTMASLKDVVFPTLYICNINQVIFTYKYNLEGLKSMTFRLSYYFIKKKFVVPPLATFILVIFLYVYVIACIAYIHPVSGAGVRTHDLLVMSHLP